MSKKLRLFSLLALAAACCYLLAGALYAADVKIVGKQMYVDGKLFTVKGVNYGYAPVGEGYRTYDWTIHPEIYKKDFALIRAMGANTIRLHSIPADSAVLDAAYEYGLYVIITASVDWNKDFNVQASRDKVISDFTILVNRWKDHPALLLWLVGNEINFHTVSLSGWYNLLNECARTAHTLEGAKFHPVTSAEANIVNLANSFNKSDDANMPDLDLWATQVYMAATPGFEQMFSDYAAHSSKPLIITEFGCDAFNIITQQEDQSAQATTLRGEINIINEHLSADDPNRVCVGAAIFQWADDWSKNFSQNGAANSVHDTSGDWVDEAYYDYVDNNTKNMNEEWWGLVSITPGTDDKTLRTAYETIQSLWGQNSSGTASLSRAVETDITNYPNPFNPENSSTKIVFSVAPQTNISVKIYDIAGNLVKVLKEEKSGSAYTQVQVQWDGRDSDGKVVANGVYICYVRADGPNSTEVKYRKILALK